MPILQASWNPDREHWSKDGIEGTVTFTQNHPNEWVKVEFLLKGLPPGLHGIHIHEGNMVCPEQTMTDNPCDCTSGHFNPTNAVHGFHFGDLCFNIKANGNGAVRHYYFDKKLTLFPHSPLLSIEGRTVVIHEKEDNKGACGGHWDEESLKTGRAGKRIACASIVRIK